MALNRDRQEVFKEEYLKRQKEDTLQLARAHIVEKNRYSNVKRCINRQQNEFEDEQNRQKRKEQEALKELGLQRENTLSRELDNIKREEIRQIKLRQQLRENTPELRDLERKLKAAYISKELAAQIAQNEANKIKAKINERRRNEIYQTALRDEQELKRVQAEEEIQKKAHYKQELQEQIILREKFKRHLYEEFLREKKMIDDIIQRIHDEDEREAQEKMCKLKKTREEMLAFEAAQQQWKQKMKEEIEEETRRIQEYLEMRAADIQARIQEKKKKEASKEKMQLTLAKQMHEEKMRKKEREDIIQDLLEEEQREGLERRHREEIEKQIRQRLDTTQSLAIQVAEKEERLRQEAAEDAKYKEQLLQKVAEDERLEQMSAQKKRIKMLQLKKDVEEMMLERRQKRAEEMQLLIKLKEQEDNEMKERRRIIEEERLRMLKDHVKNLVGFLPKGLLRPDDLPHLGSNVLTK